MRFFLFISLISNHFTHFFAPLLFHYFSYFQFSLYSIVSLTSIFLSRPLYCFSPPNFSLFNCFLTPKFSPTLCLSLLRICNLYETYKWQKQKLEAWISSMVEAFLDLRINISVFKKQFMGGICKLWFKNQH